MEFKNLKVMILDDEKRIRDELTEYLERKKSAVYTADRPSTAFHILKNTHVDLLFLDLALPEMDGIHVLKKIKRLLPEINVIMISGNDNLDVRKEAKLNGAVDFLSKPFLHNEVRHAIECLKLNHV